MSTNKTPQADHEGSEAHMASVGLGDILRSPTLGLAAEIVDDLERVRIANENRLRQLTRTEEDSDGIVRGFELDPRHPDVLRLQHLVDGLSASYDEAVKNLQKTMRAHPLGAWVKKTSGVGEKQAARLLAAIGDPYWNDGFYPDPDGKIDKEGKVITYPRDRPRTVSELWAFCGYHVLPSGQHTIETQVPDAAGTNLHAGSHCSSDTQKTSAPGVAARRKKGAKINWSTTAKMRAFLIAESCVKAKTSPYRKVYDETRAKYADAVHKVPCERCGPSGKPALPGSALNPGHQHARALRAISKAVLKDLWIESKRLHELQQMQTMYDSDSNSGTSASAA